MKRLIQAGMAIALALVLAPCAAAKTVKTTATVLSVAPASTPKTLTKPGYNVRIRLADQRVLDLRCLPGFRTYSWNGACKAPEQGAALDVELHGGRDEVLLTWADKSAKHGKTSEIYQVLTVVTPEQ
jgi:hypothetical protein